MVVEALVKRSAKLDIVDKSGRTALHYASLGNNTAMVEALIKRGAKLDIEDKDRMTALDLASELVLKEMLAEAGANRGIENNVQTTEHFRDYLFDPRQKLSTNSSHF